MRAYVDHVLALLPFEPAAMRQLGRPALHLCRPSAERAGRAAASERRGSAPAPRRSAGAAGAAGQPRRAKSAAWRAYSARPSALAAERVGPLEVVVPTVPRLADAVQTAVATWPVAGAGGDRPGREGRGLPHRARGARQIRHLDARTGGRRRADGRRLQSAAVRGGGRPPAAHGRHRDPGQSGSRRKCGAGTPAAGLHARKLAAALAPLLGDTPERRRQIEAFARLDDDHGDRPGRPQRPGGCPWSWIAPVSDSNRRAKQWYPPRQQRNLPVRPKGLCHGRKLECRL